MRLLTKKNLYRLIFIVSLAAMLGSLYYSEIEHLVPCLLCWYQRIVMYPIVVVSAVALIRKTRDLAYYVLPLSLVGVIISGYHYSLQKLQVVADSATPCVATGVSCTEIYVEYFGFITIPFLALVAFIMISAVAALSVRVDR